MKDNTAAQERLAAATAKYEAMAKYEAEVQMLKLQRTNPNNN
jgi:hypothetical protein